MRRCDSKPVSDPCFMPPDMKSRSPGYMMGGLAAPPCRPCLAPSSSSPSREPKGERWRALTRDPSGRPTLTRVPSLSEGDSSSLITSSGGWAMPSRPPPTTAPGLASSPSPTRSELLVILMESLLSELILRKCQIQ